MATVQGSIGLHPHPQINGGRRHHHATDHVLLEEGGHDHLGIIDGLVLLMAKDPDHPHERTAEGHSQSHR